MLENAGVEYLARTDAYHLHQFCFYAARRAGGALHLPLGPIII